MEAVEAVTHFIRRAVVRHRRDRYAGLVASRNGRDKFLCALDHDLEREIEDRTAVPALSETEWKQPGFLYASDGSFGVKLESLRHGYENTAPQGGGWLIISQSATIAIYRPEDWVDDERYFRL